MRSAKEKEVSERENEERRGKGYLARHFLEEEKGTHEGNAVAKA